MKSRKITLSQIKNNALKIASCRTLKDVAELTNTSTKNIVLLAFSPQYYHFTVPKKNGKLRHIEAPEQELKRFQRKLNIFLQSVYYLHQSKNAYGYIINPKGKIYKKGVLNNAKQHLGCNYLMNVDFKDFFHQITIEDVKKIFKSNYFNFNTYTSFTLAKICCYKNRLPMGSPASPVLSNLYTISLDHLLHHWAIKKQGIYTRFVDDLAFSSKSNAFSSNDFYEIQKIAAQYHLNFNPKKTKFVGITATKTITGLILKETVDIDDLYYKELNKDIKRLKNIVEVYSITGQSLKNIAIVKFKQEIVGKINFIKTIEGATSQQFNEYLEKFQQALLPKTDLVIRWQNFSSYA